MRRRNLALSAAALAAVPLTLVPVLAQTTPTAAETVQQEQAPTVKVGKGDLASSREFKAKVSFGDPWNVQTPLEGTVTQAPEAGAEVGFGEELVRVNNQPLFLAEGSMPMYRELSRVPTRVRSKLTNGEDVAQLQRFLKAQGHGDDSLPEDGFFGTATERAVKAWQKENGLAVTGRVDAAQLVFSPQPLRISKALRVGQSFSALEVTGSTPIITIDTSARDRSFLAPGTKVELDVPGVGEVTGTTEKQTQEATEDGGRIWRTTITPEGELPGGASLLTATAEETVATDALLVPVSALLALAEGGFAVEVPDGAGTRLVPVQVGGVVDGQAEITGDVDEGTSVVVPS